MRVRLLYAAGAIAGLGLWGAVLAGAQEPPQGHGHRPVHHGDRPPARRWSGLLPTRTVTVSYEPRTTVTAYIARPPVTDIHGKPVTGLPPVPHNPHVAPKQPGAGPQPAGPSGPAVGEPAGPTFEHSLSAPTSFWSNYWEVYRRALLRDLRDWKQPRHQIAGEAWADPLVQVLLRGLLDRDPWVVAESAVALGGTGRPELFPLLSRLAAGPELRSSHIVRSGALLGVGLCPEPQASGLLQRVVAEYNPREIQDRADKEREQRAGSAPGQPIKQRGGVDLHALTQHEYRASYALTAMGFTKSPDQLEYLIALVKRDDLPLRMRTAALTAAARHEDAEAAGLLVAILITPHLPHQLRGVAAIGIGLTRSEELPGTAPGTRPANALIEVLKVTGVGSRSTRLGIASGLGYCALPEDLKDMRAWLDGWKAVPHVDPLKATPAHAGEDDTTVRCAFLASMARVARTAGAEERATTRAYLESHLDLKYPAAVRGFAALGLGMLQEAGAAAALLKLMAGDSDSHVQASAAVALGLLDHTDAVGPMIKLLSKLSNNLDKQADAAYVIEGLGLLRTEEARALLRKRFAEAPDQHQRRAAGLALAVSGDESIVLELVNDLGSGDQWRGPGAAFALSFYPQDKVRVVLMQAAQAERPEVRQAAIKVLGAWLHDSANPRIQEFAAPGVVFPRDGAHLYDDLLVWQ
jgi:HEAT repeat protein